MTYRHELANEAAAIRVAAADIYARLINATDANEIAALSKRLADLHERSADILERINRLEKVAA